jgi:hypothetical protein
MGLKRLSMETLKEIDSGMVMELFHSALQHAVTDCMERPADKRPRKVTLQLTLKPVAEINGTMIDCDGVRGCFQCRAKLPDMETKTYDFGVQQGGKLVYNEDSLTNHRQTTMLENE